ncbi:MAG: GNAT family N-acetyltransferase [Deltaproteobacteria bacterium]|nr:GNAT family N-acetyltransferase [Deltaproteobacteria bacterium]
MQRRAFYAEAVALGNFAISPLTQDEAGVLSDFLQATLTLKAVTPEGAIVGSARGLREGDATHVRKLIVDPPFQGRGLGAALLSAIEEALPAPLFKLFTRQGNEKALSLYQKRGYRIVAVKPSGENFNFAFLEKKGPA